MVTNREAQSESGFHVAYAHSAPGRPEHEWHRLEDHLREVGNLAAGFAAPFGAAGLARLAGYWHDLGKYAADFQAYLREDSDASSRGSIDHSSAGAVLATNSKLHLLAFPIAGHHSGLSDFVPLFRNRLIAKADRLESAQTQGIPDWLLKPKLETKPSWTEGPLSEEFLIRMLFSALIDADRLDTERFCDPEVSESRELERPSISTLLKNLEMQIQALSTGRADIVSAMRARVVDDTRAAANRDRGLFSLTVPTGGGKTLSGMLFALKHALRHRLKRVIVAIPFTSITEQTADVYRSIFGEAAVVEHHSAIDPIRDTDANRRASENWDAPIIVTTNVQLFETMFTNRPSRARKLHSISESVLILDEAQTLPVGFLEPILHALNECVEHYRSSVVFSTATQPAFSGSMIGDRKGLVCAEIIRDQRTLFESLERVTVSLPSDLTQPTSWEQIAERIRDERQALVITHQRKDARQLASLLPSSLHLSAAMCAEHRSAVIREVKRRLLMNEHCILVSTQVVEAGVDIDFPLVLRALGPLDSLAQAAGRCNREGRLRDADGNLTTGLFEIYVPPSLPPPSTRSAISVTSTILNTRGFSLTDPALFSSYFARLYRACVTDEKGIQHLRRNFNFERVAEAFVLIDDSQVPVVVPYGDAQRHVERLNSALEAGKGERRALRALQRFIVNVPRSTLKTLVEQGEIEELGDLIRVLRTSERYDATFGLRTD